MPIGNDPYPRGSPGSESHFIWVNRILAIDAGIKVEMTVSAVRVCPCRLKNSAHTAHPWAADSSTGDAVVGARTDQEDKSSLSRLPIGVAWPAEETVCRVVQQAFQA